MVIDKTMSDKRRKYWMSWNIFIGCSLRLCYIFFAEKKKANKMSINNSTSSNIIDIETPRYSEIDPPIADRNPIVCKW